MGKTGSVEWVQVKGRKGQIRLVAHSDVKKKSPGPNQRFNSNGTVRRRIRRSPKSIVGSKGKK